MSKSTLYKILSVLASFVGILTLGGLGNAAMNEPFYWVPFVLDIPFFVTIGYKLWRAENPKEGK